MCVCWFATTLEINGSQVVRCSHFEEREEELFGYEIEDWSSQSRDDNCDDYSKEDDSYEEASVLLEFSFKSFFWVFLLLDNSALDSRF